MVFFRGGGGTDATTATCPPLRSSRRDVIYSVVAFSGIPNLGRGLQGKEGGALVKCREMFINNALFMRRRAVNVNREGSSSRYVGRAVLWPAGFFCGHIVLRCKSRVNRST